MSIWTSVWRWAQSLVYREVYLGPDPVVLVADFPEPRQYDRVLVIDHYYLRPDGSRRVERKGYRGIAVTGPDDIAGWKSLPTFKPVTNPETLRQLNRACRNARFRRLEQTFDQAEEMLAELGVRRP